MSTQDLIAQVREDLAQLRKQERELQSELLMTQGAMAALRRLLALSQEAQV